MLQTPPGRQRNSEQIPATYSGITSPTKSNLILEESRTIKELREDQSQVVLKADRGIAMVVIDKVDYTDKALSLLTDTSTYRNNNKDPTIKLKNKLTQTLKDIKQTGGLSEHNYRKVYLTSAIPPKFYGLHKIHKSGTPSDPLCPAGVPLHME